MRIVFFALLFANLVMGLWQSRLALNTKSTEFPQVPATQRLQLVAEQQAAQAAQRQAAAIEADQAGQADQVDGISETGQGDAESLTETADNALTAALPEIPDIDLVSDEQTETADEADSVDDSDAPLIADITPAEPVLACYTVGPFKDLSRVQTVTDRLLSLGAPVERRSKTEQEQYGYRVYLESYPSRSKAIEVAAQLADQGIRDYFVISDEADHLNAISLGLFRKRSGAIRRMAQVRRFGFRPLMEIRYRETLIYWLDYEQQGELINDNVWREISEASPDLQRLDRECPGAVS